MNYRTYTLDNGLQILAQCNDRAHTSAFGFFVRAGSRDETAEIGGVSHFLEHMVFKGTPNRSAADVNLQLDEMGSHSNARTGEESTIYHAAVLPEFQIEVVDLLTDIMRPSLRLEDFETEKKVIVEEIMMYADQPPYGGYETIMESFYGDHPLGQSVLGTVESVTDLTPESMRDYFRTRYSPSNMVLAAAGKIDFDQLVSDVKQKCGLWKNFEALRQPTPPAYQSGFKTIHKPNSHQQYLLQMTPGASTESEQRFAARVAATIIGDDAGSRFYWEFLDSGLAESAGVGTNEYQGGGSVMAVVCCDPQNAQANLLRMKKLMHKAADQGATEKELTMAKKKIASHILLASERTESHMFSVGTQWLNRQDFKTPKQIADIYQNVTLQQVNEAMKTYALHDPMTVVVGPRDDLVPA
jgi:predicted Zn-dependent peptidase